VPPPVARLPALGIESSRFPALGILARGLDPGRLFLARGFLALRLEPCGLPTFGLDSCSLPTLRVLRRCDSRGLLPFGLLSRGLDPRRFFLARGLLTLCLLPCRRQSRRFSPLRILSCGLGAGRLFPALGLLPLRLLLSGLTALRFL